MACNIPSAEQLVKATRDAVEVLHEKDKRIDELCWENMRLCSKLENSKWDCNVAWGIVGLLGTTMIWWGSRGSQNVPESSNE